MGTLKGKTVCEKTVEIVETWVKKNNIQTAGEGQYSSSAGETKREIVFNTKKYVNDQDAQENARHMIGQLRNTLCFLNKCLSDIKKLQIGYKLLNPEKEEVTLSCYF